MFNKLFSKKSEGVYEGKGVASLKNISKRKWRKLLFSNKGVFERAKKKWKKREIRIGNNGLIIGDMFAYENSVFHSVATELQKDFYDKLTDVDCIKALQYIIVIINADKDWAKMFKTKRAKMKKLEKAIKDAIDELEDAKEDILKWSNYFKEDKENMEKTIKSLKEKHKLIVNQILKDNEIIEVFE